MAKYYYNGVLLPEIPKDVLADYPYCWICLKDDGVTYRLVFGKYPWYYSGTMNTTSHKYDEYKTTIDSESFEYVTSYTDSGSYPIGKGLIWANHDIMPSSAQLYLKGSDPVPEVLEDEKWYQISSYTLHGFADEARRIDHDFTKLMTPPMMLDVFKGVPSYGAILEGYNVVCYDEYGNPLEVHRVKKGHSINKPNYNCKFWQLKDGSSILFPITPTDNMFLYAFDDSLVSELYDFYGIDKVLYPYLQIGIDDTYVTIWFGEAYEICHNETFGTYISYSTPIIGNRYAINYTGRAGLSTTEISNLDLTDINQVVEITMSKITKVNTGTNYMGNDLSGLYTNFAHDVTGSVATLRLDD